MPGCIVTRLTVDDSFTLTLCGIDREIVLRIDGEGRYERAGSAVLFDPDRDPVGASALLGLLNRRVDDVALRNDGGLTLVIDGALLSVDPADHTVSWSVRGPDGTRASCLAEGRVVWE